VPATFTRAILDGEYAWEHLQPREWTIIALLAVVTLVSVVNAARHGLSSIATRRRAMVVTISVLCFLAGTLFVIPLECPGFLFVLFVPLADLHARYFVSYRGKWTGRTLLAALLAACVLMIAY
jgi:hypothetical protein